MDTEGKTILFEECSGVAVVTLNRPESFNAISDGMLTELTDAFETIRDTPSIRAVLLCGRGKSFCSGGDVKEMIRKRAEQSHDWTADTARFNAMAGIFLKLDKITVCAVQGIAAGAGCNLAIGADFTFAAENARFVEIFTNIGLMPDAGGLYTLPRIVGAKRAMELMVTHRTLSAEEAFLLGMINKVLPEREVLSAALAFAEELANGPTLAYRDIKRLLRKTYSCTLDEVLAEEAKCQSILSESRDLGEGLNAYTHKRKAVFTGE